MTPPALPAALHRLVDRAVIAIVRRSSRFAAPGPLCARPADDLAHFVLDAPYARFTLPRAAPRTAVRFSLPSPAPVGDAATDRLTGFVVRPEGEPAAAVLLVSGWMARGRPYFRWLGARLARHGVLVAGMDLPAHGARTPAGAMSGTRFLTGDLHLSLCHLRQAVADARSLLGSLQAELRPQAGPPTACGFSLGAWVSGTAASREGSRAILVTPAVDPARLVAGSALLQGARRAIEREGFDVAALERELRPLALVVQPAPRGGALLIAGREDLVIPVAEVRALAAAWNAPLELIPTGHMTPYISPALVGRLVRAATAGR